MKYIVFDISKPLLHNDSGMAFNANHIHERRTMHLSELMFVNEGEIFIRHLESYHLRKNDVLFLPQNIEHYGTQPSNCRLHWHHFYIPYRFTICEREQLNQFVGDENMLPLPMMHSMKNTAAVNMLSNQLEQYNTYENCTRLARNSLVSAIIGEIAADCASQNKPLEHKRLHSMLNYIDHNFLHYDITVRSLAEQFGYNEKYIACLFKKYVGSSPLQYIISAKMREARNLLANTSDTIQAIALNLNYESVPYFCRQFKAFYGVTPSQLRKSYTNTHEIYMHHDNR